MVRAQSQKKNDAGNSRSKGGAKKMKDLHDLGISCSMQNANPSSKISSGKGKDRKEIIASSSGPKDFSPLRRSTRESPMKKLVASNSNSRKSERLENPSVSTPLKKGRIERQVKKVDQSPLRKSERIDKSSGTSPSGCKNYSKSSDSSGKKKGNAVKNEGESKSKNLNVRIPPTDKKRKQMTARSYRALISSPAKKVKESDSAETQHERDSLAADSEAVLEGAGGCCPRKISEQNVKLCKGELKEDAECSSSCSKEDSVTVLGIEGDATLARVDATQNLNKAVTSEYADNLGHSKCSDTSLKPTLGKISMKEPCHDVFHRLLDGDDNESDACKKNTKDLFLKSREISFPDSSDRADALRENKSSPVASTSSQQTDYLGHSTSQQDAVPHVSPVFGGTTDDTHEIDLEAREKICTAQRSLHLILKPELSKLCKILKLPENVTDMTQLFLEYIMYNHHVNPEPEVILQAFKISLCWRAASFLKHQINHEESLALAKKYLNFTCDEEQTSNVYSKLRILKKKFSQKDSASRKKRESGPPSSGADITEEPVSKMSTDSSGPNVSKLEKGARNEDPEGHNVLEQLMLPEQEQDPGCATHTDLQEYPGSQNDELIRNQINLINKICSRREADLCVKQNEEILDFNKHKEKMEMSLKKEHEKRIEPFLAMFNDSTERENNIQLSSENFAKNMAVFSKHMSVQYEKLKSMQSVARDKEHQIKNHWLEEAKGGKLEAVNLVDFFHNIPLSDSGFTLEEFKVLDQDDSHDSLGIGTYDSDTIGSCQNEQTGSVLSVGNLVTTERPSKNFEAAIVSSPGVAGCLSGQHETFITQSYSVDEVLRDMPLEVPSSVPFTDTIDTHTDTVALASELPIMDIVTNVVDDMPINCRTAATEKQGFDENLERSCSRSCPSQIMDQGEHMNNGDGVCLATLSTEIQEPCINEHARTDNSPVFDGQGIGSSQEIPTSNSSDFLTFQDELITNNISVSDYFDNPLPIGRVPMFAQCEDSVAASGIEQGPSRQMSGSLQNDTPTSEPAILSSSLGQFNHSLVSQIVDQSILQNSHMRSQNGIGEDLTNVSRQPETFCYPLFPLIQLMPTQGLQPEPLKNELARIRMHEDRIAKMHEDMKLKHIHECEQEMLKVRQKYDMLLQDAESEYVQSKKTLATIYDKVLMNQVLAEEFRAKFIENQGGSSSTSQGQRSSSHHLLQASQPQFVQRAASSTISMSSSLPVTRPSAAIPLPVTRPAAANLPPDTHPSAAVPLPVTRPSATIPLPVTRPAAANLPPDTHPSAAIPLPVTRPSATIPLPVTRPLTTIPLPVTRPAAANLPPDAHPSAASPLPVIRPSATIPLSVTRPTVANLASSAAIPLPATRPLTTIPLPVSRLAAANLPPDAHPSAASPLPVTSPAAQSNSFATLRLRAPSIPSSQTVRSPSSVFPSNSVRHHFSSMLPPRTNIQVGSEARAPAPHLQRFRANASLTSSSVVQISRTSQHNPCANIVSTTMGQVANTPNLQACFLPVSATGEPVVSNSVSVCQDASSTSVGLPLNVGDISIGANQQSSFQLVDLVPTIDRSSSNFPSTLPGLSQTSAAAVDGHRAESDVVCISDDES
ncbi:uncharacterized protein LOC141837642 [Curcuma longa]|uniref:uncharacterized protein LOC141837642 n=1 Tax=Curcuma longa TaxID=136217 RepID=UPI003D9EBCFF